MATKARDRAAALSAGPDALLDVVIIGAGFAGIGMAHSLKKHGIDSFVILDKAATVGGLWRDTVRPISASNVPSHHYAFSCAPNPNWTRAYPLPSDIHAYLERCTDDFGLRNHVSCNTEVHGATFDETSHCWSVRLADGRILATRLLISAAGPLNRPAIPRMSGSATREVPAIQFVPALADEAGPVTVLQRSDAYLDISVPGMPNFFMLGGPDSHLGQGASVPMLESQIAHVMRCLGRMAGSKASRVEVGSDVFLRQDAGIQARLAQTVWSRCQGWDSNEQRRNTIHWPGVTIAYRWLTRRLSLDAYRFSRSCPDLDGGQLMLPPQALTERLTAWALRGLLRSVFRPLIGPPFPAGFQRGVVALLATFMPGISGVTTTRADIGHLRVDVLTPRKTDRQAPRGAMLYLHGGAFCLGNARSHRSVTTRLARSAGVTIWVPDYRLAPEHPYPAGLDDVQACWNAMRRAGHRADDIVIAGDSAGGNLALALALILRDAGQEQAAGLVLFSPVVDPELGRLDQTVNDPMIRRGWLQQALAWYRMPSDGLVQKPLSSSLHGLPPMLIQAGDQEILLSDAVRLAHHARRQGVDVRLEVHSRRWHVFQLQAAYLASARRALVTAGAFARACLASSPRRPASSNTEQAIPATADL